MSHVTTYVVIPFHKLGERVYEHLLTIPPFYSFDRKYFRVLSDEDLKPLKRLKRGYAVGFQTEAAGGERYYTDCFIQYLSEKFCNRIYYHEDEKKFFMVKNHLLIKNVRETLRREYEMTVPNKKLTSFTQWLAFKVSINLSEDEGVINHCIHHVQYELERLELALNDFEP